MYYCSQCSASPQRRRLFPFRSATALLISKCGTGLIIYMLLPSSGIFISTWFGDICEISLRMLPTAWPEDPQRSRLLLHRVPGRSHFASSLSCVLGHPHQLARLIGLDLPSPCRVPHEHPHQLARLIGLDLLPLCRVRHEHPHQLARLIGLDSVPPCPASLTWSPAGWFAARSRGPPPAIEGAHWPNGLASEYS